MNNLCNQYNISSLPRQTKQEQKVWKDKLQEEIELRANKEFQEQLQNMSKTQDLRLDRCQNYNETPNPNDQVKEYL